MQVTWKVEGRISLKSNDSTIANVFPGMLPLAGVQVKVSAREKILGVWGPFNSWDTVTTNSDGYFEVKKEKDKSDRQFKIEVLFKDNTLKIYPENDGLWNTITEGFTDMFGQITDKVEDAVEQLLEQTSRIAYDVKWFKILDEDKDDKKHSHGTIDFGYFIFGGSSKQDLGDSIAVKHATAWFVYKKVFSVFNGFGKTLHFDDKKPVALKYPHDNPIIGDNTEAAYSDPYNYIIFIIRNKKSDWFNVDTIVHELMHIWAYQHCEKEKAMAWQLAIHGSTHSGLQKKSFVAFHEGFAEWASNRLTRLIFGKDSDIYGGTTDTGVPFSRRFLKGKNVKNESDIDKSEYAWISLFNILMTPDLHLHNFNSSTDYAAAMSSSSVTVPSRHVCSSPALTFDEILSVFIEHESDGYKKVLTKNEMNLDDFLERAKDISDKVTQDHVEAIKILLDPSKTDSAVSVICLPPKGPRKPGEDWKPPKDLQQPPVISGRRRADNKKETDKAGSRANRRPATKSKKT